MKALIFLFRCIGFLSGVAIICLGLYAGLWLMLIGGIIDIINQIKADEVNALVLAVGIVKALFFQLPIAIGFFVGGLLSTGSCLHLTARGNRYSR